MKTAQCLNEEQLSNLFLVMYHCHRIMMITIIPSPTMIIALMVMMMKIMVMIWIVVILFFVSHFTIASISSFWVNRNGKRINNSGNCCFSHRWHCWNGNNNNGNKQNQSHHFVTRDKNSFVLLLIRLLFDNWCSSHHNAQPENNRNREKVVINTVMEELIARFQEYTYQSIDRSVVKYGDEWE